MDPIGVLLETSRVRTISLEFSPVLPPDFFRIFPGEFQGPIQGNLPGVTPGSHEGG